MRGEIDSEGGGEKAGKMKTEKAGERLWENQAQPHKFFKSRAREARPMREVHREPIDALLTGHTAK